MTSSAPFLTILTFTFFSCTIALDLGHGRVYNSPAAAIYWKERFGDLFSGGQGDLREIQLQGAELSKMEVHSPTEPIANNDDKQLNISPLPTTSTSISPSAPPSSPPQLFSIIYYPYPVAVQGTFISTIMSNQL
eukprot:TRINITY_DN3271_c0_g1_i2.p1 TRINITY_DN3271_c0_g1~~TRINITY_DN3271_c0_g1_i2.p1  ORF type:complete len:134 (-),score=16.34 TRINITY_DN3271_c0_g1_i2:56-457(-)